MTPASRYSTRNRAKLYFYENTGTVASNGDRPDSYVREVDPGCCWRCGPYTKIIVSAQMPAELRGAVHTTVLTPDARYVYIIGPSGQVVPGRSPMAAGMGPGRVLRTPATLLKVDALTLKPIKQLAIGGRMHHAQIFQDKYMLNRHVHQ